MHDWDDWAAFVMLCPYLDQADELVVAQVHLVADGTEKRDTCLSQSILALLCAVALLGLAKRVCAKAAQVLAAPQLEKQRTQRGKG